MCSATATCSVYRVLHSVPAYQHLNSRSLCQTELSLSLCQTELTLPDLWAELASICSLWSAMRSASLGVAHRPLLWFLVSRQSADLGILFSQRPCLGTWTTTTRAIIDVADDCSGPRTRSDLVYLMLLQNLGNEGWQ